MKKFKIMIIGAGVAGAILARRLSRIPQFEVCCLEKVSADDHSEAGTGLNVGPNAIKALLHTDPALAEAVLAASLPWASWRVSLTDGRCLFDLPLAQVADNPGIRIRWSELYRVLRAGTGATVRYGTHIEHIGPSGHDDRRTTVRWVEDGKQQTMDDIDLLIGTDGRYSATRATFSGAPQARQVGVAILRTLVEDHSQGLIDDYEQWFNGPHRLLAFRVPPGHIYIAATFPIDKGAEIPAEWKTGTVMRQTYLPAGTPPCPKVAWLLDAMCDNLEHSHWARMQESDILYADPQRQVMYVGDSAHGMVPTLGQGATQAIEDACIAADILEQAVTDGNVDVRQWLEQVATARSDRMRFVMDLSIAATDTMLPDSDPVTGAQWKTEPPFLASLSALFRDVPFAQPAMV